MENSGENNETFRLLKPSYKYEVDIDKLLALNLNDKVDMILIMFKALGSLRGETKEVFPEELQRYLMEI